MEHHGRCLILAALAVYIVAATAVPPEVAFTIVTDGAISVSLNGKEWLSSNETFVYVGDEKLSSKDGSLTTDAAHASSGTDNIGSFQRTEWSWKSAGGSVVMVTAIRIYDALPAAVFEQSFPNGIDSVKTDSSTMSGSPTFSPSQPGLSSATFNDPFLATTTKNLGTGLEHCQTRTQSGPVLYYDDDTLVTMVFSQLKAIKTGEVNCTGQVTLGLKGTLTSVPEGFSAEWVVSAGQGVKASMMGWGNVLLANSEKKRADLYGGPIRSTLGFWTDNGGWFHYPPFTTAGEYNTKLMEAVADFKKQDIPIRHWQGDSWWYPKGAGGYNSSQNTEVGVYHWVADPFVLPKGMDGFQSEFPVPFILHNRWLDPRNWYKANGIAGGADGWTKSSGKYSLPFDFDAYFEYFFTQQKGFGLVTYEQDFIFSQYKGLPEMRTNATFADKWLNSMAEHADKAGLTMQFCMPFPREYLVSSQHSNVVTIRATGDYSPTGSSNWKVQPQSLLAHAVGVLPFKDTFLSSNNAEPGGAPRALGPEPTPDLQTLVSLLTGSTVAPGDGPGFMNKTRLMQTCRSDGLLLKADRPAVVLDVYWTENNPGGQFSFTVASSEDKSLNTTYVLAAELSTNYQLKAQDLELDPTASYVVYDWYAKTVATLPFTIPKEGNPHTNEPVPYNYYVVAESNPMTNSWAVFGDTSKFVSGSSKRITGVVADGSSGVTVHVTGVKGEAVNICGATGSTLVCETGTISDDGTTSVSLTKK